MTIFRKGSKIFFYLLIIRRVNQNLSLQNENVGVKFCLFEQASDTIDTGKSLAKFIANMLSLDRRRRWEVSRPATVPTPNTQQQQH